MFLLLIDGITAVRWLPVGRGGLFYLLLIPADNFYPSSQAAIFLSLLIINYNADIDH